jgi:hypothetical protein
MHRCASSVTIAHAAASAAAEPRSRRSRSQAASGERKAWERDETSARLIYNLAPTWHCDLDLVIDLRRQGLANNALPFERCGGFSIARAFVTALTGVDGIMAAAATQYPIREYNRRTARRQVPKCTVAGLPCGSEIRPNTHSSASWEA